MPRHPACTGVRAWTAWAPTAAFAHWATGAPAASWTWTSARANRARTGACATTWSTGEREGARRARKVGGRGGGRGVVEPGARLARAARPVPGSGATARTRATRVHAASRRCWSARRLPARITRPAARAWGASAVSAGQVCVRTRPRAQARATCVEASAVCT